MSNSDDVKMFLEGCDWESLGLAPKKVVAESVEETQEVNESDDLEAGFYDVDGKLFFVNEDQEIFDVFTDEDEQIFIFHENHGLHQVFEDEDSLMFEEVDMNSFEILEEEVVEEAMPPKLLKALGKRGASNEDEDEGEEKPKNNLKKMKKKGC
jgi:hypothetical protein